jgi:hypothetical protein
MPFLTTCRILSNEILVANRRRRMDAEAVHSWVAATLGSAVSRVVRACDDASPMSGEPENAISVDENVVAFNILSAELVTLEQDADAREAAHSQAMLEAAKAAQEGQRGLEGRCVELMAELSEQRASAHVVTPKRMKLMEDLAEKRASSWKRSLELMTKLAEQRDDAVRQLEEEGHQHAQSHPEPSNTPEAPQLPQPSHALDEAAAAAALAPGLQRRLEEMKAEAAQREEMLAGLEEVHVVQREMISALEGQLREQSAQLREQSAQLRERELELERRTIECRAIERRADELERRLQGREALETARDPLEVDGIDAEGEGHAEDVAVRGVDEEGSGEEGSGDEGSGGGRGIEAAMCSSRGMAAWATQRQARPVAPTTAPPPLPSHPEPEMQSRADDLEAEVQSRGDDLEAEVRRALDEAAVAAAAAAYDQKHQPHQPHQPSTEWRAEDQPVSYFRELLAQQQRQQQLQLQQPPQQQQLPLPPRQERARGSARVGSHGNADPSGSRSVALAGPYLAGASGPYLAGASGPYLVGPSAVTLALPAALPVAEPTAPGSWAAGKEPRTLDRAQHSADKEPRTLDRAQHSAGAAVRVPVTHLTYGKDGKVKVRSVSASARPEPLRRTSQVVAPARAGGGRGVILAKEFHSAPISAPLRQPLMEHEQPAATLRPPIGASPGEMRLWKMQNGIPV